MNQGADLTPENAAQQIAAHLYKIQHQHFFKSFEDWLALAVNAFLRDDPAYMAIIFRYGPREVGKPHAADHYAHALGTWMRVMQLESADYLGRVYEQEAITNGYSGQFFTPEPLVEMMAAMTMPETLPDTALVSDPACGSGRMLIAGIRRNRYATFVGTDVDLMCVHMTALNCLVRNANTYVIHGNSLTLESYGGYFVRRSPFGGELFRLGQAQTNALIRLPLKAAKETALTSASTAAVVHQPSPDTNTTLVDVAKTFPSNARGQKDFGF